MHMKVFSKVYCDSVYILCAERFVTGSGFEPPAAPLYPFESRVPPPPGKEHYVACLYLNINVDAICLVLLYGSKQFLFMLGIKELARVTPED